MSVDRQLDSLTREERARYLRHLVLPEVGLQGQERIKAARILLVGAGGLGAPAALYLTAAGVGRLGIVDDDVVDRSNLQRQVLFGDADVGRSKVQVACERLAAINPHVELVAHAERLAAANAPAVLRGYDLVLDGTDNFAARYLLNDAAAFARLPLIQGSVLRFTGQVAMFRPAEGPCYRCLFPAPPRSEDVPNCAEAGVLGVLPGSVGALMAAEALKWALGAGRSLVGQLLLFDALALDFRRLAIERDLACALCGDRPSITTLTDLSATCEIGTSCMPNTGNDRGDIDVFELKRRCDAGEDVFLLDVRQPYEWDTARLSGATLIPLAQLPARLAELDASREIVVYCAVGGRSARAVALLHQHGFARARNLVGGIQAWAQHIDPSLAL